MQDHSCPKTKQVVRNGTLHVGCDDCLTVHVVQGDSAAHFRRYQQAHYRRELTQKNQGREFIRAYGIDKAREAGYDDELIRRLS
jgi:hypothetical protein